MAGSGSPEFQLPGNIYATMAWSTCNAKPSRDINEQVNGVKITAV